MCARSGLAGNSHVLVNSGCARRARGAPVPQPKAQTARRRRRGPRLRLPATTDLSFLIYHVCNLPSSQFKDQTDLLSNRRKQPPKLSFTFEKLTKLGIYRFRNSWGTPHELRRRQTIAGSGEGRLLRRKRPQCGPRLAPRHSETGIQSLFGCILHPTSIGCVSTAT